MDTFPFHTLLDWFVREAAKDAERGECCQCGSEKTIKKSSNPEKMSHPKTCLNS